MARRKIVWTNKSSVPRPKAVDIQWVMDGLALKMLACQDQAESDGYKQARYWFGLANDFPLNPQGPPWRGKYRE